MKFISGAWSLMLSGPFNHTDGVQRKIIHIDMDCFYAAVEIRDNPLLANKPVAVGGNSDRRGVLCTCNYVARKFGLHSAMPTVHAFRLCPDLILLPVNMPKYKEAANIIHSIFREYTDLVEPLSLDEAYLDVSNSKHCMGSATLIAEDIRKKIRDRVNLTSSAGVAPNKFLAKIASGWKKPNGLFVIHPNEIAAFVRELPVEKLHGVGKITTKKLHSQNLKICADLANVSLERLVSYYGKFGKQLYQQARGIDERPVISNGVRKSLSVEHTFSEDLRSREECIAALAKLYPRLTQRIQDAAAGRIIKNQYIKVKFNNFKQTTHEKIISTVALEDYTELFCDIYSQSQTPIRLLGLGVHFLDESKVNTRKFSAGIQQSLL